MEERRKDILTNGKGNREGYKEEKGGKRERIMNTLKGLRKEGSE